MAGDTRSFLDALFLGVPEQLYSMLWTLADKRSHWLRVGDGVEGMAALAKELGDKGDVYVSVSVADRAVGPHFRISSDSSAGIMGLWADVDIADPDVHKKWNLPPSVEAAREVLDAVGLTPSVVVHSGHGLQAWWLFEEFWGFETVQERQTAAGLAQNWNTTLRVRAAERGWTIDSTFDLARVMRVPGTRNFKGHPVQDVRLLDQTERRYSQSDFEQFLVDEALLRQLGFTPDRTYVVGALRLRPDAAPPFAKFEALKSAEPNFDRSWERKRKDLQDQSPSSYDLSLAAVAVQAGWSDQEIADLIIASRVKHGDDLKLRQDYYSRTIAKAHETHDRVGATEQMDEVQEELSSARRTGDDEQIRDVRRRALEGVSKQLGIEVIQMLKLMSTPPTYRMVTPTGGVNLGEAANVLSWYQMRAAVASETDRLIPRFKSEAWDRLVQLILDVCEETDVGLESTERGQVYGWLTDYLLARPAGEDLEAAILTESPYRHANDIYVFGSNLRRWLWFSRGERVNHKDLGRLLRTYGCEPVQQEVTIEGRRTKRSAWRLPSMEGG